MTARQFPCDHCGAPEMTFDPVAQQLRCPYCNHVKTIAASGPGPTERAVQHGLQEHAQEQALGFGGQTVSVECQTCGARVAFGGVETTKQCEFCSSPNVLRQEANRKLIRPESLVPFQIDQNTAQQKFKGWLSGLWFRPNALKHKASMGAIRGVYIPYWTFDATADGHWTAERGHYYYEETTRWVTDSSGKQVQQRHRERHTRWENASGRRRDKFDDELVVASRGLPPKIAAKLKSFNTAALAPYSPEFLAGWAAEEYAVPLDNAFGIARESMKKQQYQRCSRDVGGDTQRSLRVQTQLHQETFKHILLPLWIASYRFNDKPYRFLVNGQTGEVQGEAPYSIIKIALMVLLIMFLIGACVLGMSLK